MHNFGGKSEQICKHGSLDLESQDLSKTRNLKVKNAADYTCDYAQP
jgi:hypothetical protein